MSWTAEFLSASDIQNLIDDGTMKSLYDDSKDHIDNGKNYTAYSLETDEDSKYNHWCNMFLAFANANFSFEKSFLLKLDINSLLFGPNKPSTQ